MSERKKLSQFAMFVLIAIVLWGLVKSGNAEKVENPEPEIELVYIVVESESEPEQVEDIVEDVVAEDVFVEDVVVEDDLYWLSRIISAEAKGESIEGQIAVGNVVLNRMKNGEFPDTLKGVIFQKNQFSPVSNGMIYDEPTSESVESAKKVLVGEKVVGDDVLFFYNPNVVGSSSWIWSREVVDTIGNHNFAR